MTRVQRPGSRVSVSAPSSRPFRRRGAARSFKISFRIGSTCAWIDGGELYSGPARIVRSRSAPFDSLARCEFANRERFPSRRVVRVRAWVRTVNPSEEDPRADGIDARGLGAMPEDQPEREIWRLRDQVFGLEAELARFQSGLLESDARRRAAESRAEYLDKARLQRDAMLASSQWRIGGWIVGPLVSLRRLFSRAHREP